jgi:hypothetical protein
MPETTPVLPTVATEVETLLHTPPVAPLVSEVVPPTESDNSPDIEPASGNGLIVTTIEAVAAPQLLEIV